MKSGRQVAEEVGSRICRPQRIGVFGHRGVGKTTLLAMLYREAVAGRLPGLRLAAADARTAEYLADKVLQLESGQPLPATLAETELRWNLYHGSTRLELLLRDYQGEHVEIGRREAIREFLNDCDAVWICLDASIRLDPAARLRRQQEIEQLLEDFLAAEPGRMMNRPVALVLTKADLLGDPLPELDVLAQASFGMTHYSLQLHCANSGLFTVSSLGASWQSEKVLQPRNLAEPLVWLATSLTDLDQARLARVESLAPTDLALGSRCVQCLEHRYPGLAVVQEFRQKLARSRRQRFFRRTLAAMTLAACTGMSFWTYDALGYQAALRQEQEQSASPDQALEGWRAFQAWHPTRTWLGVSSARAEEERLRALEDRALEQECAGRLALLRQRAHDPDADPEEVWQQFLDCRQRFPRTIIDADLDRLRSAIKSQRDEQVRLRARRAHDELVLAEQRTGDAAALVVQADRFLRAFPGSCQEADVRRRLASYLRRLDEKDIQAARDYSARHPFHFQTRREQFQRYLDKHAGSGAFVAEAEAALRRIDTEWDRHDFRLLRDQWTAHPDEVAELVARCRTYLAAHPTGQFVSVARELLRWSERVTAEGEYQVTLQSGQFDRKIARYFSWGPDLSVELEVGGVRYGPSPIVVNRYDPEWSWTFPRPIRWKLGDSVRVLVSDHDWGKRVVLDVSSEAGDPHALRLLTGEVWSGSSRVTFSCDFALPTLPEIE